MHPLIQADCVFNDSVDNKTIEVQSFYVPEHVCWILLFLPVFALNNPGMVCARIAGLSISGGGTVQSGFIKFKCSFFLNEPCEDPITCVDVSYSFLH